MSAQDLHRGMLLAVKYATVYDPVTRIGTFVEIPRIKILADNSVLPREEAQRTDGINRTPLSASVINQFALAMALAESDSWVSALRTAQDCLTPVWFLFQELGKTPRIVGGEFGCSVIVEEKVMPDFGSLEMLLVSGATSGNTTGSTFVQGDGSGGS